MGKAKSVLSKQIISFASHCFSFIIDSSITLLCPLVGFKLVHWNVQLEISAIIVSNLKVGIMLVSRDQNQNIRHMNSVTIDYVEDHWRETLIDCLFSVLLNFSFQYGRAKWCLMMINTRWCKTYIINNRENRSIDLNTFPNYWQSSSASKWLVVTFFGSSQWRQQS